MQKILVATDGSEGAGRAVDFGVALARATGAKLSIIAIVRPPSEDEGRFAQVEGDVADPAESFARRALADAEARARASGDAAPATALGWGEPTQAIIELARTEKPDALLVGRRGHGVLAGLLLGSVSQKLVALAPCPVIVVP